MTTHEPIPADFPVQPLQPGQQAGERVTCGHCGLSWDDSISTTYTPTPSGRCPFEHFHIYEDDEEGDLLDRIEEHQRLPMCIYGISHVLERIETYVSTEQLDALPVLFDVVSVMVAAESDEAATDINEWLEDLLQAFTERTVTRTQVLDKIVSYLREHA